MRTKLLIASSLLLAAVLGARADVLETKNGARLVGTVVSIDGSTVVFSTEYAGDLKIKQSEIVALTTEKPMNIRLQSGTVLQGTLTGTGAGAVLLTGKDGSIQTTVDKLSATWAPGAMDPAVAVHMRRWAYEVAVDIAGKTGNKEQLGTMFSAAAVLKTQQDALGFYTAYNRQISEGEKSADQFKAGVDYQNNFAGKLSWYVRDEGGFDRVKNIELYNVAAAGLGYDFIREKNHTLTGRTGLAFRYESYRADPDLMAAAIASGFGEAQARRLSTADSVKSAGLDFGLKHTYALGRWNLVTNITYTPLFEDFGNYRILHDSYFEIPTADPFWKLRVGVSNDYNSTPTLGTERLDTSYFARLVLNWK